MSGSRSRHGSSCAVAGSISEWAGKLQVKGDLADPQVLGELNVQRGFFDLLDRRFTIERGEVDFVGTRPPLPMIDLQAKAQTVDVVVTVVLKGPAADPKLTLSSEPTLPQDEILSRLLFGTVGGPDHAGPGAAPGGGRAAAPGRRRGQRRPDHAAASLPASTRWTCRAATPPRRAAARAGKYISDKVYVEVQRGVTDGSGKASVQVELTPQLSVGTSVTEQSQTGVGLQWKYDY